MVTRAASPQKSNYEVGKRRIVTILDAAKKILIDGGYSRLSLRRVASAAGLELRSLQYYFKTKDKLIQALIQSICDAYLERCRSLINDAKDTPETQFTKCIDYLIVDNMDRASNTVYFELLAMSCHDDNVADPMNRLYLDYRSFISDLILKVRPELSSAAAARRALRIVILLEGLSFIFSANKFSTVQANDISDSLKVDIFEIANGRN